MRKVQKKISYSGKMWLVFSELLVVMRLDLFLVLEILY